MLQALVVKRPQPKQRRSKHLCADAGYRGRNAMSIILAHGYIPHVVGRKSEADKKRRDPKKKARRWVVEACHGWLNRFRKLLVHYEKLEHTFSHSTTWPLPSSPNARSCRLSILFTDESLSATYCSFSQV